MGLQVGDKAPAVLGVNQDGKELKMADFAGKKVVLYFYPIRRVVLLRHVAYATTMTNCKRQVSKLLA